METRLEFYYVPTSGAVVSATPLERAKGAKAMGFAISRIEIFHVDGSRIVRDMAINPNETRAFDNRLVVSVSTQKPIKRFVSYSFTKEPNQVYLVGTGKDITLGIHRDIAQLTDIMFKKENLRAGDRAAGIRLMMSAHIGLLNETIAVALDSITDDVSDIIEQYQLALEACKTKEQVIDCLDNLRTDMDKLDALRLMWEIEPAESLYRRYQDKGTVALG